MGNSEAEELKKKLLNPPKIASKPSHWASRANAPYYKEIYALQLKQVLDGMEVDREDVIFRYEDYPKFSHSTIYLRINQSILYLLEKLDCVESKVIQGESLLGKPLYHYARLKEMIAITRERDLGIRFSFDETVRTADINGFKPSKVMSKLESPKWKHQLENFLDNGEGGSKLVIKNLALTSEEVNDLKVQFAPLDNILAVITSSEIKIVKKVE